jgi:hypothetical protein
LSRLMRPVGVMWLRVQAPTSSVQLPITCLEQVAKELVNCNI